MSGGEFSHLVRACAPALQTLLHEKEMQEAAPLFAEAIAKDMKAAISPFIDQATLDALPEAARKAADESLLMFEFLSKRKGVNLAPAFTALLGAQDNAAKAMIEKKLAHRGLSPAIGVPYDRAPNWGLQVQSMAGFAGSTRDDLFRERTVLVCPSANAVYGGGMTRTYAMNATGHAGPAMGDRTNYDAEPTFIRMDLVERPTSTPLIVDSARTPNAPPTRTASVLDFRQEAHVTGWLGRWHGAKDDPRAPFQVGMVDGSASAHRSIDPHWLTPLP
ncbi:hypothetical protein J4558_25900 [Leptolyngbya sp. 15MV]|nr:hypothetical protein J4558_25900 [Leptolyngbya sp. 15MV]